MADAQVAVYILSPPSASVDELANAFNSDLFHDVKVVSLTTPKGKDRRHTSSLGGQRLPQTVRPRPVPAAALRQCAYAGNSDALAYSINKWIQQSDTYDVAVLGEGTSDQGLPNALLDHAAGPGCDHRRPGRAGRPAPKDLPGRP